MKKPIIVGIVAIIAVLILAIIIYLKFIVPVTIPQNTISDGINNSNPPVNNIPDEAPSQINYNVIILDMAFIPQIPNIKKGTTVIWTNKDSFTHSIISDTGLFSSGVLQKGDSFSYTFNELGVYNYHCGIYPGLKGKIVIV
jgi:plastocyanin